MNKEERLFEGFSEKELSELLYYSKAYKFPKNHVLFEQLLTRMVKRFLFLLLGMVLFLGRLLFLMANHVPLLPKP